MTWLSAAMSSGIDEIYEWGKVQDEFFF